MKYYKQIKVALIVGLIALICLWLYGCEIKRPIFKDIKTGTAALSDCYAQMRDYRMTTGKHRKVL
jgi:predicted small secreted protein